MKQEFTLTRKRYKYYVVHDGDMHKVICVSHYAGKSYRGIAICSPDDTFNLDKGMTLAKLRCDRKINAVKNKYVDDRIMSANIMLALVQKELRELACLKVKYMKEDVETESALQNTEW